MLTALKHGNAFYAKKLKKRVILTTCNSALSSKKVVWMAPKRTVSADFHVSVALHFSMPWFQGPRLAFILL